MTGRGYGLTIERTSIQKNYGKKNYHTMRNCNTKTYFIADCTITGMAVCRVCGKHWCL
jgi:hypothetical protein